MRQGFLSFLVLWLCLVGAGSSVQANDSKGNEVARRHFVTGVDAYDIGDYELAVREFRAAYAITGHADLLYNIYQASDRAGRLNEAEEALAQYLEEGEVEPERLRALEQRLARLRERLTRAGAGDAVEADGSTENARPFSEAPLQQNSGRSGRRASPGAIGMLLTAGTLAVSFAVFAGLSKAEDNRLATDCGRDAGRVCTDGQLRSLRLYNLAADVSWIGALGAGITGIVLLFTGRGKDEGPPPASAWVGDGGGGVTMQGRF